MKSKGAMEPWKSIGLGALAGLLAAKVLDRPRANPAPCPLRADTYGGLPEGGEYEHYTEYEIGAERAAEAAN